MNSCPRDAERPRVGDQPPGARKAPTFGDQPAGARKAPTFGEEPASGAAQLIPPGLDAVIVLLRHGQTQFIVEKKFQGAMEAPLTALGEEQARLAGRRLAVPHAAPALPIPGAAPFAIVHSPLGRARRSAELAVAEMNAAGVATPPLRVDAGFSEIAQGGWEGLTEEEITAQFGEALGGWRRWPLKFHAEGGESLPEVVARVEPALTRLLADMAVGTTPGTMDRHQVLGYGNEGPERRWSLIVAHGGVFKVVACAILGLPLEHFWNFDFGLGAITVIEIRAGRAVLLALNADSHLSGDSGSATSDTGDDSRTRNASGAL
ncbi:MAG TPA: histidine phosphatase family protein [Candidatus Limnocylindrales bacterium]